MFRDVAQPHLVRSRRREVTLHVVVVDGRTGTFRALRALGERAEDLLFRAQPPDSTFTRRKAGAFQLVGDEPVAEDRVVVVGVDRGVRQVGVLEVASSDGTSQPAVVVLGGEFEDPTRHRDGEPVGGQLADERVLHFGLRSLAK